MITRRGTARDRRYFAGSVADGFLVIHIDGAFIHILIQPR
jgi:hypothetical protein